MNNKYIFNLNKFNLYINIVELNLFFWSVKNCFFKLIAFFTKIKAVSILSLLIYAKQSKSKAFIVKTIDNFS